MKKKTKKEERVSSEHGDRSETGDQTSSKRDDENKPSGHGEATSIPCDGNGSSTKKYQANLLHQLKKWLETVAAHLTGQHNRLGKLQVRTQKQIAAIGEDTSQLKSRIDALAEGQARFRTAVEKASDCVVRELGLRIDSLAALFAEGQKNGRDQDLLKTVGMKVSQYDEFIRNLKSLAEGLPENCFAFTFAQETITRLQGMRAESVSLLAAHDMHLIDSASSFDSACHRPVGTSTRPEGAQGDGEVQRIGLLYRNNGRERVIQPALVVLYEDVEF